MLLVPAGFRMTEFGELPGAILVLGRELSREDRTLGGQWR
jgi:hypothetical protein